MHQIIRTVGLLSGALFLLLSTQSQAETLDRRISKLENMLSGFGREAHYDGVVPERTIVYKTSNNCQEIKKTKMYFDAIHPFKTIARIKCANKTYLVVRWFEKDGTPDISINTVLADDVIVAK